MISSPPPKSVRQSGSEWQRFLKLAKQVSETVGAEFFSTLVNQLREVLGAKCAYIGEFVVGKPERVRTLAAFVEAKGPATFDFPLAGSPDAEVAAGIPCMYTRGVREIFPGDCRLHDLEVEACVGVSLNDGEGQPTGLIAVLYSHPLDLEIHFIQSMLTMFAPRAAAELSRKQAEDTLRENEQRYRAFVQMNPDACWRVEFDEPIATTLTEAEQLATILRYGRVAECNDALLKRLGREQADQVIGSGVRDAVGDMIDIETIRNCLQSLIRSGYRYSTVEVARVDHKGKRSDFLQSHWGIVENGKLHRVWGSSRDVTELRET